MFSGFMGKGETLPALGRNKECGFKGIW